jgi:hypothetical protein
MLHQAQNHIKSSSISVPPKILKMVPESMELVAFGLVLLGCLQSLAAPDLQGKALIFLYIFKHLCRIRYYSTWLEYGIFNWIFISPNYRLFLFD